MNKIEYTDTNSHKSFNENESLTLLNFVLNSRVADISVLICVTHKMCYTSRRILNAAADDHYYFECNAILQSFKLIILELEFFGYLRHFIEKFI